MCVFERLVFVVLFFFFKQKTAYEMRISDWSSDVCSSDLSNPKYEIRSDRHKERMPLSALLDRLRSGEPSNDYYVTANNGGHNREALAALWSEIGDKNGRASCRERVWQYV